MNQFKNVTYNYYKYVEEKQKKYKSYKRIFNNINYAYFNIIIDNTYKKYYFEFSFYSPHIPDYVKNNIKSYMKKYYNLDYYIKKI